MINTVFDKYFERLAQSLDRTVGIVEGEPSIPIEGVSPKPSLRWQDRVDDREKIEQMRNPSNMGGAVVPGRFKVRSPEIDEIYNSQEVRKNSKIRVAAEGTGYADSREKSGESSTAGGDVISSSPLNLPKDDRKSHTTVVFPTHPSVREKELWESATREARFILGAYNEFVDMLAMVRSAQQHGETPTSDIDISAPSAHDAYQLSKLSEQVAESFNNIKRLESFIRKNTSADPSNPGQRIHKRPVVKEWMKELEDEKSKHNQLSKQYDKLKQKYDPIPAIPATEEEIQGGPTGGLSYEPPKETGLTFPSGKYNFPTEVIDKKLEPWQTSKTSFPSSSQSDDGDLDQETALALQDAMRALKEKDWDQLTPEQKSILKFWGGDIKEEKSAPDDEGVGYQSQTSIPSIPSLTPQPSSNVQTTKPPKPVSNADIRKRYVPPGVTPSWWLDNRIDRQHGVDDYDVTPSKPKKTYQPSVPLNRSDLKMLSKILKSTIGSPERGMKINFDDLQKSGMMGGYKSFLEKAGKYLDISKDENGNWILGVAPDSSNRNHRVIQKLLQNADKQSGGQPLWDNQLNRMWDRQTEKWKQEELANAPPPPQQSPPQPQQPVQNSLETGYVKPPETSREYKLAPAPQQSAFPPATFEPPQQTTTPTEDVELNADDAIQFGEELAKQKREKVVKDPWPPLTLQQQGSPQFLDWLSSATPTSFG